MNTRKFIHPDGSYRCRALHPVRVVFFNDSNVLTARTDHPDGRWREFGIEGFELFEPGRAYS